MDAHDSEHDFICAFAAGRTRVIIERDSWEGLAPALRAVDDVDRWVVIADEQIAATHGSAMQARLAAHGMTAGDDVLYIRAGDANKTLTAANAAYDWLAMRGVDRHAGIIGLGGGMTGDLAGFVAATWLRGIAWVCCPTTTLAMVDACVGGKVGVNLPAGKNLVGAFHHPRIVYANIDTLRTLSDEICTDGLAESVKHALGLDAGLLDWLEQSAALVSQRDSDTLRALVTRNIRLKSSVVLADERERASLGRAVLNLGHTVGHALEAASDYQLRHGECVALGTVAEMDLAVGGQLMRDAERKRIEALLTALRLPTRMRVGLSGQSILSRLLSDKKRRHATTRIVVPNGIGRAAWLENPDRAAWASALRRIGVDKE